MFVHQNHTLCEMMNRLELNMITFGHAVVDKSWSGNVLDSTYSRLYFILRGSFFVTLEDGRTISLKEGGCYLIPSGIRFSYGCHSRMEHIFFHVKLCGMDAIDLFRSEVPNVYTLDDPPSGETLPALMHSHSPLDGIRLKSELYGIVFSLAQKNNILGEEHRYSPCVSKAIEYIHSHRSVSLAVDEIASYACVSRSTLTKHFRKELNITITEYIYEIVMTEVCRLLCGTDMTISEISETFGFCDAFYFSRRFSQRFGISPRDYHKNSML